MKLEYMNPGGSVKDRAAKEMILQMQREGSLKKGMTIVEPTSGNTGIGLAMVAASLGYDLVITIPQPCLLKEEKFYQPTVHR